MIWEPEIDRNVTDQPASLPTYNPETHVVVERMTEEEVIKHYGGSEYPDLEEQKRTRLAVRIYRDWGALFVHPFTEATGKPVTEDMEAYGQWVLENGRAG